MNTQIKLSFMRFVLILSALTALISTSSLAFAEPIAKIKKSTEDYFAESYQCLKKNDKPCAQIAAANVPSQSPFSKLLIGIFASLEGDFDTTFRELLPLQTNKTLNQQAIVSLHTSLALAYENQSDILRALEHRVIIDRVLFQQQPINQGEIDANQQQIWEIVSVLSKANLAEMRGNSTDNIIQGWVDLALAAKYQSNGGTNDQSLERWRLAYPDHPAKDGIAAQLFPASVVKTEVRNTKLKGNVALLLPFSDPNFYPVSDAIERGFSAAKKIAQDNADVKIYATQGKAELTLKLYEQAINEGAKYLVGPLLPVEANAIKNVSSPVTTLMLNKNTNRSDTSKQYSYGLLTIDELKQTIKQAKNLGMQKVAIISSNSEFNNLISRAFSEHWLATGGQATIINGSDDLVAIKNKLNEYSSDMFFIAAEADSARKIRSVIPNSIPTFGLSQIYAGINANNDDLALKGVQFVDLPWMVDRDNPKFSAYKEAAADLPAGEMQRWFALGADAYQIIVSLDKLSASGTTIDGLSGKIDINAAGEISRSLANASFGADGIILESTP